MKKLFVVTLILAPFCSIAQESNAIGTIFPELEAESTEQKLTLPEDLNGKYSIIGLTYNKKSEESLMEWISPLYNEFIGDDQVNTYIIMMFSGVNSAAEGIVKKIVVNSVDPEMLPHILFHKGELKKYQKFLDMLDRKDTSYFCVIDKTGKILWATRGKYKNAKVQKLRSYIK